MHESRGLGDVYKRQLLILLLGLAVLAVNLILLFREFRYRRIAVPLRVKQDVAEQS